MTARSMRGVSVRLGLICLAVVMLAVVAVTFFKASNGRTYQADLTHASGLEAGDEVRVAGLPAGEVTDIEIVDRRARVTFTTYSDVEVTDLAEASVEMSNLLGTNHLAVAPGDGKPLGDRVLGVDRTRPAYTIDRVVSRTKDTAEQLDLKVIEEAMNTISTELDTDPQNMDRALRGVATLSTQIARKDDQIGRLLTHTRNVTEFVRSQQDSLESILLDAQTVTTMLKSRRATISRLLTNGRTVLAQLNALERTTRSDINAVLRSLEDVLGTLAENDSELALAIDRLAPMTRYFANATGNGPWIDVYAPYFIFADPIVCLVPGADCS